MKVSMRKADETSGWLSKKTEYSLFVKVELTPDERAAIKEAGIEDCLMMEYSYKGLELNWLVKSVVYSSDKGSESRFVGHNAIARSEMEQKIKESLTALKSQIEAQMSGRGGGSESFEL